MSGTERLKCRLCIGVGDFFPPVLAGQCAYQQQVSSDRRRQKIHDGHHQQQQRSDLLSHHFDQKSHEQSSSQLASDFCAQPLGWVTSACLSAAPAVQSCQAKASCLKDASKGPEVGQQGMPAGTTEIGTIEQLD